MYFETFVCALFGSLKNALDSADVSRVIWASCFYAFPFIISLLKYIKNPPRIQVLHTKQSSSCWHLEHLVLFSKTNVDSPMLLSSNHLQDSPKERSSVHAISLD